MKGSSSAIIRKGSDSFSSDFLEGSGWILSERIYEGSSYLFKLTFGNFFLWGWLTGGMSGGEESEGA